MFTFLTGSMVAVWGFAMYPDQPVTQEDQDDAVTAAWLAGLGMGLIAASIIGAAISRVRTAN